MFDIESYVKADSVSHAIGLLKENPLALPIAGGTDVLVRLHEGNKAYRHLVDIHGLPELQGVELRDDGAILIGSGMTFAHLAEHPLIKERIPMLAQGAGAVGGPQVRNAATIGGNLCNAAPCADSASPSLCLEAKVLLSGPEGERSLPLSEYFTGVGKVAKGQTEIMTGLLIEARDYQGWSGHYFKYAIRGAMDISTIGCGANVKLAGGKVEGLRMAYSVAGPTPLRCYKTEAMAQGKPADAALLELVAGNVLQDLMPRDSWRASKDFREHLIRTLAKKVLAEALKGAGVEL